MESDFSTQVVDGSAQPNALLRKHPVKQAPVPPCPVITGQGGTGACLTGCFLNSAFGCADPSTTCVEKSDSMWHTGICVGQDVACDPVTQSDCAGAETCEVLGGPAYGGVSFYCEALTGSILSGDSCSDDVKSCAPGLTCFQDTCRSYCTPGGSCGRRSLLGCNSSGTYPGSM